MEKLKRKDRVVVIHKIEDLLEGYCRHCPYNTNADTRSQCDTCPIGGELREYGRILKGTGKGGVLDPVINKGPWTAEQTAQLLELRKQGITYYKISIIMGRSQQAVYKRAVKIGEVKIKR